MIAEEALDSATTLDIEVILPSILIALCILLGATCTLAGVVCTVLIMRLKKRTAKTG